MKAASCVFNTIGIIVELFFAICWSFAYPPLAPLFITLVIIFLAFVIGGYASKRRHIALGICLLLFVNLLGGIFYLCWNDEDKPVKVVVSNPTYSSTNHSRTLYSHTNSESEKIELLNKYKKLLDTGIITQEEFDKKKEDLLKQIL